jgi:lipopolysaccharide export system protein LptA
MQRIAAAALLLLPLLALPARAQELDMSQGGPVTVTSRDGIDWDQNNHEVIAHGNARAVRGTVTVDADRLIAYYRKKTEAPGAAPAKPATPPAPAAPGSTATPGDADTGSTEIYRLAAEGNVKVYTPTDQAQGDHAVYDMDKAVLVMTGHDLKLTTPNEVLTAKDALEYYPQQHMAVARGDAVVVTKDARRMAAGRPPRGRHAGRGKNAGAHRPDEARRRRCDRLLRQAGEGRGLWPRLGPHRDRHGDRRPRRLCTRHRHRPRAGQRADHARRESAERCRGRGEPKDRHLAAAVRQRRTGAGSCRSQRCQHPRRRRRGPAGAPEGRRGGDKAGAEAGQSMSPGCMQRTAR